MPGPQTLQTLQTLQKSGLRAGVARVGLVWGYLFPAELAGLLEGLEGFGGYGEFEAWQTAALNAYKKQLLRPWGALEPLLWPCGDFCVREWRMLGGRFGGFEAWQT